MDREARWKLIAKSVRGASHKRANKPCQDAFKKVLYKTAAIMAIADGHGSAKCKYSAEGALLAVDVACLVLKEFYRVVEGESFTAIKKLKDGLAKEIVTRWRSRVKLWHAKQNRESPSNHDEAVLYGSTLLAVLVTKEYVLFFQLGDGDILIVMDSGETTRPFPLDGCQSHETASLCSLYSWNETKVQLYPIIARPPSLIMMCTDGYSNAFVTDNDFVQAGMDYLRFIQEQGTKEVARNLSAWLNEASVSGSGDDVTVGIVYREDDSGIRPIDSVQIRYVN